jgi:protein-S-isoprenylcysteine O-methyltransferase Ste14
MSDLDAKVWRTFVCLFAIVALLLFVPAGARYWQAWLYLAVFFGASGAITRYLMIKDPALLRRRLRGGPTAEKEPSQKIIMFFTSVGFLALLVVSALDHRFNWSNPPAYLTIAADVLILLGLYIVFLVYKENSFTSATIEVAADQRVVSTGPYALVRHPMYAGSLLYLVATPLALGSWWGLLAAAGLAPFLWWRLVDEERFLKQNLPGYADYCLKLRWRLIPGVF